MLKFSAHSLKRIDQRLSLHDNEILDLIQNVSVDIGKEDGSNKVHKLFYSELDNLHFIAVIDVIYELIITIIPFEYAIWQIDESVLINIKTKTIAYINKKQESKTRKFEVRVVIFNEIEHSNRFEKLGKFDFPEETKEISYDIREKLKSVQLYEN